MEPETLVLVHPRSRISIHQRSVLDRDTRHRPLHARLPPIALTWSFDRSMLFAASHNESVEVVLFMLGLGLFDVEEKDSWRVTPLMSACEHGRLGGVKALVEGGITSAPASISILATPFATLQRECVSLASNSPPPTHK